MAALPDADRQRVWRGLMRFAGFGTPPNVLKADLKAAVDATDDWIEANQAAFNTALPAAFRTNATTAQKTILFCAVALMRVSQSFLMSVLGQVD
jgi:hypothetical protein